MQNTTKIKNLSAFMVVFTSAIMLALPLLVVWIWSNFASYAGTVLPWNRVLSFEHIASYQLWIAGALQMAAALLMVYGLWHLRRLFGLFKSGVFFTSEAVRHLNSFTLILFVSAIIKPILSSVLSVVLTLGNPPGQSALVISFGSNEVASILIAGTLFVVTWVLREAKDLAAENAAFV